MDKSYHLAHLIGPVLRHRRFELGIVEETIFEKFRIKVCQIEKGDDVHYRELIQLCKFYQWSLSQFFDEVDFLDKLQKMA